MRIAGRDKLTKFMRKHARARSSLQSWMATAEEAIWETPQDIKLRFHSADFLSNNRVIFNISGNNYRLVVLVRYVEGQLLILKIGTHAEYDKWKLD
jgi:mRNA interferase HigB